MSIVLIICKNPKLGDASFAMSTTYCNDHDWGDNVSYDLENLFKPHDEYVWDNIESGFGRVSTLAKNNTHIWRVFNLMKFLMKVVWRGHDFIG